MAFLGRTERRLALAIVLTAVIPLVAAIYFASTLVDYYFGQAFRPELGQHLDRALGVYQELARTIKENMRHEADAIAADESLRDAANVATAKARNSAREAQDGREPRDPRDPHGAHGPREADENALGAALAESFTKYPDIVRLEVASAGGETLASHDRGRPVDDGTEATLEVRRPLADGPDAPVLVALFTTPRARFEELERTSEFVRDYHQIERARIKLKRSDVLAFASILGATIVLSAAIATWLARGVTRRIGQLAAATQAVARGDLTVRVPEQGKDELAELSRGFNRMLEEVEASRARIEFLQRMSSWQEMARRLAHEIKNPLTPILLAVEECHRKYGGDDPAFRKLLDTTLEIVEEEVGTLGRLVGEFSSFARLPRANLIDYDLGAFLREQRDRMALFEESGEGHDSRPPDSDALARAVHVVWSIPDRPMPVLIDPQMLRRVLINVVRNAAQAIVAEKRTGRVEVSVMPVVGGFAIAVDDDGPGVPDELRASIFDPYVTTKSDGTGLGLAIVKKIVMEHGGTVEVGRSLLGGARFQIRLPILTSPAAAAARELDRTLGVQAGSGSAKLPAHRAGLGASARSER